MTPASNTPTERPWGGQGATPLITHAPAVPRTLAVVGSRDFPAEQVAHGIAAYSAEVDWLVSGGAIGVDRIAEEYAEDRGWTITSYRPVKHSGGYAVRRWINDEFELVSNDQGDPLLFSTFREAAMERNWMIVRDADFVLAFWTGTSSGTAVSIAAADRLSKPHRIWMDGDS